MRKRMLVILFISLVFHQLHAQDSVYYSILWKPKPLQREAKISQEKIYEYNYIDNVVTDSGLLEVKFFDTLGQLTKQQFFKNNQQASELRNYYTGFVLDSSIEVRLPAQDVIVRQYRYDSLGRLLVIVTKRQQGPVVWDQYVYNDRNQPLQIVSKPEGGKEYVSTRYEYRSDNLIKRIEYMEEDGKRMASGVSYSYDKKKRITTRFSVFSGGTSMLDCIRTYNEGQQLIKLERPSRATIANDSNGFQMSRWDEEEIYFYRYDGLLHEKYIRRNEKIFKAEKHFYY